MKDRITTVLKNNPGLKGGEIAKKLGDVEKKTVNSFLFHNPDGFTKDTATDKWYLDTNQYVLEITTQGWVDEKAFERSLMNSGCMLGSTSNKCIIRFPANCQILLIAGARLIALVNQAIHIGKEVQLDFSNCPKTQSYLNRLGLFDHIHDSVIILPEKPKKSKAKEYLGHNDNLMEIATININDTEEQLPVKRLTTIFSTHAGEEYYMAAFTIFAELIKNIQEHSETQITGFAALQIYKGKRKHIQVVISDSGLGIGSTIKRSLENFYPDLFEIQAKLDQIDAEIFLVSHALRQGGLSRLGSNPDKEARGLGLNQTQNYAAKYDAEVTVRQQYFELKLIYQDGNLIQIKETKELRRIDGTQVCFDFFLS